MEKSEFALSSYWDAHPLSLDIEPLFLRPSESGIILIFICLVTPINFAEIFGPRKSHLNSFCGSLARRGTSWGCLVLSAHEPNLQFISSFFICMSYSFFICRMLINKQGTLIPDLRSRALPKCPLCSRNKDQNGKIKLSSGFSSPFTIMYSSFDPKYRLHFFQSRPQMWSKRRLLSIHHLVCTMFGSWSTSLVQETWTPAIVMAGIWIRLWVCFVSELPSSCKALPLSGLRTCDYYSDWSIPHLFGRVMTNIFLPLRGDTEPVWRYSGFWLLHRIRLCSSFHSYMSWGFKPMFLSFH